MIQYMLQQLKVLLHDTKFGNQDRPDRIP
jgi:hypothetical protein